MLNKTASKLAGYTAGAYDFAMPNPARPQLRFDSYENLLSDVEQLHATGWEKTGQWSLATMCDHLAKWTTCMLDGGLPRIPGPFQWIARAVIRRMAKKQKYPMIPFKAPGPLKPVQDISEPDAVAEFRAAVTRLQHLTGPTVNCYSFGSVLAHDFQQLALLHAAHHLSFLRPKQPT